MKRKGKRSRKSIEGFRAKYLGDLRHMLRCCQDGRLPPASIPYLEHVLLDERWLPKPSEVAEQVQFTYAQQQANHLYTIPAVDKTEEELAALRRAKDARRKMRARRKAKALTREVYLAQFPKPWIAAGVSRSTWYRRKAKGGTGSSGVPKPSGTGSSAHTYFEARNNLSHSKQTAPQLGQHGNGLSARPRPTNGAGKPTKGTNAKKKNTLSSYGHGPVPPHRGRRLETK